MLNNSASPHNELEKLLHFLNLEETKEVLARLKSLAEAADRQAKASPFSYRITLIDNVDGRQVARQVLPDGHLAEQMRHQFIGNFQGLNALSKLLDDRKAELEELITEQNNKQNQDASQQTE